MTTTPNPFNYSEDMTDDEVRALFNDLLDEYALDNLDDDDDGWWPSATREKKWDRSHFNWITDRIATGSDHYLFNDQAASELREAGITHVIDCRSEGSAAPWSGEVPKGIHYFFNGCQDDGKRKTVAYFKKTLDYALKVLREVPDAKFLIHCAAGMNRGPSNAYAVVRAFYGWSPEETENRIVEVRPIVGLLYMDSADRALYTLGLAPKYVPRKKGWVV